MSVGNSKLQIKSPSYTHRITNELLQSQKVSQIIYKCKDSFINAATDRKNVLVYTSNLFIVNTSPFLSNHSKTTRKKVLYWKATLASLTMSTLWPCWVYHICHLNLFSFPMLATMLYLHWPRPTLKIILHLLTSSVIETFTNFWPLQLVRFNVLKAAIVC